MLFLVFLEKEIECGGGFGLFCFLIEYLCFVRTFCTFTVMYDIKRIIFSLDLETKLDVSNISSCACPKDQDTHATCNFSIPDRDPPHTQVEISLQATLKMRNKGRTGE